MAGLKKIVGVTLAVVLATALVAYMLRPSATPTTTSTSARPGAVATHGALTRVSRPEAIMLPHEAVGRSESTRLNSSHT